MQSRAHIWQRFRAVSAIAILAVFLMPGCLDHANNPSVEDQNQSDGWIELNSPEGRITPTGYEDRIRERQSELHDPAERGLRSQELTNPQGGISTFKVEVASPQDSDEPVIWIPRAGGNETSPIVINIAQGCLEEHGAEVSNGDTVSVSISETMCADNTSTHLLIIHSKQEVVTCGGCPSAQ